MNRLHNQLVELILKDIEYGLITKRKHPALDLWILSYSKNAQMNWHWDLATITCRGLIVDKYWNVVARPFQKFFTLEQWRDLRNSVHHLYGVKYKEMFEGPFSVSAKLDGSLGILYADKSRKSGWAIATKGSFDSEQAIRATQILENKYGNMPESLRATPNCVYVTPLFEIVYPENQIVVNYGDVEDLFLIGLVGTETGISVPETYHCVLHDIFPSVQTYNFEDWRNLEKLNWPNKEGFVVHFHDTDIRVKVKFQDYLELHRLYNYFSRNRIIKAINEKFRIEDTLMDVIGRLLYEWKTWGWDNPIITNFLDKDVTPYMDFLMDKYEGLEREAKTIYELTLKNGMSRGNFAKEYNNHPLKPVVFGLRNGKQYGRILWKVLKKGLDKD